MKTLTFDAHESNISTMDEVMRDIAEAECWTFTKAPADHESNPIGVVYDITTSDGKRGKYDVVADELTMDDGTNGALFCWDSPYCRCETFNEFLDVSQSIWARDENGEWVLYAE